MKHVNSAFSHHHSHQRQGFDWHLSLNRWNRLSCMPHHLFCCGAVWVFAWVGWSYDNSLPLSLLSDSSRSLNVHILYRRSTACHFQFFLHRWNTVMHNVMLWRAQKNHRFLKLSVCFFLSYTQRGCSPINLPNIESLHGQITMNSLAQMSLSVMYVHR